MTKDIAKTIFFRLSNRFTKSECFTVKMAYVPFWATNGFYSRYYKRMMNNSAVGFDKSMLVCKHWFKPEKFDRIQIWFPNGMRLDLPFDISDKEVDIVEHYLKGVEMSMKLNSEQKVAKRQRSVATKSNRRTKAGNKTLNPHA